MTNQEIAEVLFRRSLAGGWSNAQDVYAVKRELDAAERRGKIAALEWVLRSSAHTNIQSRNAERELDRLRAEQAKEER